MFAQDQKSTSGGSWAPQPLSRTEIRGIDRNAVTPSHSGRRAATHRCGRRELFRPPPPATFSFRLRRSEKSTHPPHPDGGGPASNPNRHSHPVPDPGPAAAESRPPLRSAPPHPTVFARPELSAGWDHPRCRGPPRLTDRRRSLPGAHRERQRASICQIGRLDSCRLTD